MDSSATPSSAKRIDIVSPSCLRRCLRYVRVPALRRQASTEVVVRFLNPHPTTIAVFADDTGRETIDSIAGMSPSQFRKLNGSLSAVAIPSIPAIVGPFQLHIHKVT